MKKVSSIISSKTTFALITLFIQIFIWIGLFYIINLWIVSLGMADGETLNGAALLWIYFITDILGAFTCIYIIMKNDHPAYKIVWILFVTLIPSIGVFCFFFYGRHKLRKRMRKNLIKSDSDIRKIALNTGFYTDLERSNAIGNPPLMRFVAQSGCPAFSDTHTRYYGDIARLWEQLLIDLSSAQKSIYIEMFIIRDGIFWNSIKKLLIEKSLSGCDVRLIIDDIGTIFSTKDMHELNDIGIQTYEFNKMGLTFDASKNNRTHRKMIIIDDSVAYTGGFNLADEYINKLNRFGIWKDTGLRLEGPAVLMFTLMFMSFWQMRKNAPALDPRADYSPDTAFSHPEYHGMVQPLDSGPLMRFRLLEFALIKLIGSAKKYVYITTPYLVLDNETETALCLAARSGVDVRIIMPGIPDKKIVFAVSQSFYPTLLKAGVKIYEYGDGFVHSKMVIADGRKAFIGTCNLDFRSFFLHFECGTMLYDTSSILDMENDFNELQDKCREIDTAWSQSLKWYQRVWQSLARLFAPLF